MSIKLIIATDNLGGIGHENKLPWKDKEEMNHFRQTTLYNTVVMGYKTFASLNYTPLPHRKNIVIIDGTRPFGFEYLGPGRESLEVGRRVDKALSDKVLAFKSFDQRLLETMRNSDETYFIIGGAKTYIQFMPYVDEIIWAKGNFEATCDTYYQPDLQGFKLTKEVMLNDRFTTYYYQRDKDA